MTRFASLTLLFAALISCGRQASPLLPNGYKVMAMNPREIYVSNDRNELIIGFAISEIGIERNYVFVKCVKDKGVVNGFRNMAGYNMIDTANGVVRFEMNYDEFDRVAAEVGFDASRMRQVSDFF